MPEEINRLVTDAVADYLWVPSPEAIDNLLREGVARDRIAFVGNIMIDCLEMFRPRMEALDVCREFGQVPGRYGVVTLHRPANVDAPEVLRQLCQALERASASIPLVFPVHPRTRQRIAAAGLLGDGARNGRLFLPDPLGYLAFMNLVWRSRLVITDSGGIQEETSYLGIPCVTLRKNTERPVTVTHGTNRLCEVGELAAMVDAILREPAAGPPSIELWDGWTAQRVVADIARRFPQGRACAPSVVSR